MDIKDHIVLSCDTLSTTVPEAWQNLQMSSPTLTKDNIECVDEKVSHYNNCEDSSEHVQSTECVNYYDNESYVVEHLKTEFPEDVLSQTDCSVNTQIHSENKELLEFDVKTEINDENTDNGLSLNIKEENDCNEYRFIVKTEGLEEQEDVQCKFYHNTLNNGFNLLQGSNKHVKVEINTPLDNEITELHQCKYCDNGFDNYNNMLVHISNNHKQEKSKCDICGKQFKSVGNLNRHILAFHKLDKPVEVITENYVNVRQKFSLNDHSKQLCSGKEGGEDEGENKVSRNISNYGYGSILECSFEKQFPSPIHLSEHERHFQRDNVHNTSNDKFHCGSCKKIFTAKSSLALHIKSVHFDYGSKSNCWCGKQFRSPIHLRIHEKRIHKRNIEIANNGKVQCDYCKALLINKGNLILHMKRVHYDYGKLFDCWCGKQFRSPILLREHVRHIHRDNSNNTSNYKFQCDFCKKYFTLKSTLARHIQSVHFNYGTMSECWCGKQFRSPLHLQLHKYRIHKRNTENSNNGRIQCDYCKDFLASKRNLILHIQRLHYDYGKLFDCWCGKQFRSPLHLSEHERHIHRDNSNNAKNGKFQCDVCKKIFKLKASLYRHVNSVHFNNGTKLECWCGKQFRSPSYLQSHEHYIHKRNTENSINGKIKCDYCKVCLVSKRNLNLHMKRVHYDYGKQFDCWCGKQFRTPLHLSEHQRNIHRDKVHNTNNNKFQCDLCKKSYKLKPSLYRHIKTLHLDNGKKFVCWCGKQFRSPSYLHRHESRMHKSDVQNINTKTY